MQRYRHLSTDRRAQLRGAERRRYGIHVVTPEALIAVAPRLSLGAPGEAISARLARRLAELATS